MDCGFDNKNILEFHHEGIKERKPDFQRSVASLKKELANAFLLCPNCHRIRHLDKDGILNLRRKLNDN